MHGLENWRMEALQPYKQCHGPIAPGGAEAEKMDRAIMVGFNLKFVKMV